MRINHLLSMATCLCLATACSTSSKESKTSDASTNTVVIDKPVIKNLDEVNKDLRKLKHSLVRIRVQNSHNESSIGTGFFFRSRDLLVTSFHLMDKNNKACVESSKCSLYLGLAKNAKNVEEFQTDAEVVLRYPEKDLIFLKVANTTQLADVVPIKEKAKSSQGQLTVAGFFQSNPELTFTQGKMLKTEGTHSLTSIVVSQGFSGSPILNSEGELIGVVSSYKPIAGQNVGLAEFINSEGADPF